MRTNIAILVLGLFFASGCSRTYSVGVHSQDTPAAHRQGNAVAKLHIPPGHLPPPGSCRIWIPGVPPGRQSPAGDCAELAARVPRGAWLLSRSAAHPKYVEVRRHDAHKPGVVIDVEVYLAATGELVRSQSAR